MAVRVGCGDAVAVTLGVAGWHPESRMSRVISIENFFIGLLFVV